VTAVVLHFVNDKKLTCLVWIRAKLFDSEASLFVCTRAQRLTKAEFNEVTIGVFYAAVVANWIGLLPRFPLEDTLRPRSICDFIDGFFSVQRKAEMRIISGGLLSARAVGNKDNNEVFFFSRLSQPDNALPAV